MSESTVKQEEAGRLRFAIDGPLRIVLEKESGLMTVEAPVLGARGVREDPFILRLDFSPPAANAFILLLHEIERELALAVVSAPAGAMAAH
jgi:hypothetical protein